MTCWLGQVEPRRIDLLLPGYRPSVGMWRAPARHAVDAMVPLYAALLAEEQRHYDRAQGLAASFARLVNILTSAGVSYDEWVWSL